MTQPVDLPDWRQTTVVLVFFGVIAVSLVLVGHRDYPALHVILDTGMFVLSGVLALLFWDYGARIERPLPRWVAWSFGVTAAIEAVHPLVIVEWSGGLEGIAQAASRLRPTTWPPSAVLLPAGLLAAVSLSHRSRRTNTFGLGLIFVGAAVAFVYSRLPPYSDPGWFGITRPTLILPPILWAALGWLCWRHRRRDRLLPMLAFVAVALMPAHVAMLYSRAPHDMPAMIAHLGRFAGYLILLLLMMQTAARDAQARAEAETSLLAWNTQLETRVQERTTQLHAANTTLAAEVGERRLAEQKVRAQVERLTLLHEITHAIGQRQDLRSIFQVVVRSLEDQLPADFACVCLYDKPANVLVVACVGVQSEALATQLAMADSARIAIDGNGLSRCVEGHLVYEPDIRQSSLPFPARLAAGGLGAFVASPLQTESRVFGTLIVARRHSSSFTSGECEFLRQLSEHAALAAHQVELHTALQTAYDDLRQSQQAAMQQERLRALGQMASGIAHDINNAIAPVALYSEALLEREANLTARGRGDLETIQRAIADVAQTVARMAEFYRHHDQQPALGPVQLDVMVTQVLDLTRARWSDMSQQRGVTVEVVTDLAPDLPPVMGVATEIREALINLVLNAVDAMPEGGTLTMRTSAVNTPTGARYVMVEVGDTGQGMDEETQARCLEPFFTTKGDRGTGLGLAMVYGIVRRHGAELEIESAPGRGTTIRLSFKAAAPEAAALEVAASGAVPSGLHILVVDDDPVVLKAVQDVLELDGQVIVTATGGQAGIDAMHAAAESGRSFDLVITDLGMPYVDGRRVARAVKELSPSTPVILLTGWGRRLLAEGDVPPHVDQILNKPPRLRELREAIASCLSGRPTQRGPS